ncbi:MAG: lytic murein transglycosylase [Proteobacteria bacterium]|nr:lytic murein transglycosylase [Pseudomonadota bacterium]MBU1060785.1 lytic murein transglycosylase [Pseudomonadota bacterium]
MVKDLLKRVLFCLCLAGGLVPVSAVPAAEQSFQEWLEGFYSVAAENGISRDTYERTFAGVTAADEEILKKAAYQAEFTTEIWDYLDTRVNPRSIDDGRIMAGVYGKTLQDVEARFGVEAPVLLAIWSMETNYGAVLLRSNRLYYVPRSLATLAYADKRRQKFARAQLLAVLEIVQAGEISIEQLTGSWAGAMGHTQFIPTSYLAYGVDMDGDGRRDIWNSIPDALATAANLLHKNKWKTGKNWGYEVRVPANGVLYKEETKTLAQWQELGFVRPHGQGFPQPEEKAVLKLLAGDTGPGFLMMRNFFIIKRYNNSDFYALSVCLLADRLAGRKKMVQAWPRPAGSLSVEEKFELQALLKEKGFYVGAVDGYLGSNTKKGIMEFQNKQGIRSDGKPTQELLKALRR